MSTHAFAEELQAARAALHKHHRIGGVIARTACFNVASSAAAAFSGIIVARVVGPTVRGEYAAVTSWFGLLLAVGSAGQPAAVCFHVARYPRRARSYVATSRMMMLVTGTAAIVTGLFLAPELARGNAGLASAYRVAFATAAIAFIGTSYTFALQASDTRRWNKVRVSQPVLALTGVVVLWKLQELDLLTAIGVITATMAIQLCYAYYWCRRSGLAPGRARAPLMRPLTRYGLSQLAALTPATVNAYLDQLVLSQLVPPADLGRYAIAVSATLVPIPLVSAIGNVAFPRLAAQRNAAADSTRLPLMALAASAGLAGAVLLPIAASAYWLIPAVFGPAYRGAVPLLWVLTPGSVFLACGQVAGDLLRGLGQPRLVAVAQGLAAVFTVILLVTLLPVMGVTAAAIASTVAYGTALAVMIHSLRRRPHRRAEHAAGRATATSGKSCEPESVET